VGRMREDWLAAPLSLGARAWIHPPLAVKHEWFGAASGVTYSAAVYFSYILLPLFLHFIRCFCAIIYYILKAQYGGLK
jgi:hypothetical protein